MDTSTSTMEDPLIEAPTLPELSFDDLLVESPVKRNASALDDPLELEQEEKGSDDDTLHTPRPKKAPLPQIKTNATGIGLAFGDGPSASAGALRAVATTTAAKTGAVAATPATTIAASQLGKGGAAAPVLLNSRNLLPKSGTGATQLLKITPKLPAKPGTATPTSVTPAAATATTGADIGGKTAVKTPNGQTWYIQKTTAGLSAVRLQATTAANATTAATAATTTTVATSACPTTALSTSTTAAGSKTVAIQVLCAGGAAAKNALTLPPNVATQLSGKRIISASGGQVLLKPLRPLTATTVAATTTTAAATASIVSKAIGITTTAPGDVAAATEATNATTTGVKLQRVAATQVSAAATTASGVQPAKAGSGVGGVGGGKIVVQSSNGKQIVVSNQHLIKLSPKTSADGAAGAVLAPGGAGGQLQAVQLAGKPLQYVRVMSNSRLGGATNSTVAATTTSVTSSGSPSTSAIKILGAGAVPQKFTMVRPNVTTAKTLLTQSPRKEGGVPVTFSPVTSKVQKTIVTVPTFRTIADGQSGTSSSSSNNSSANSLLRSAAAAGATGPAGSLVGKHKISEINSEIQRITSGGGSTESSGGGGGSGPPDAKKVASGSRIVVVSRSMLRTSAGGPAPPVTVQGASNTHNSSNNNNGKHSVSQHSHNAHNNNNNNSSQAADGSLKKQLFTVLKGNNATHSTAASQQQADRKSLLICGKAQALLAQQQQQHKSLPQKRTQQQVLTQQQQAVQQNQRQLAAPSRPSQAASDKSSSSVLFSNKFVPIQIKEEPLDSNDIKPLLEDAGGVVRRKHCNCSKSQCLKLYCDCFANGEFCQNCTCKDCFNNLQYEDERQRAIKICLERNPSAFKPKITTSGDQGDMRLHNKGCNCKRSGCLKNYCECYEAKIPCSSNCKCLGCRNIEERPDLDMDPIDPKVLATIVNASLSGAGQKRAYDKANSKAGGSGDKAASKALALSSDLLAAGMGGSVGSGSIGIGGASSTSSNGATGGAPPEKQQCNFITQEVVDATIQCMISQADECEKNGLPAYQTEKMVMEEMGRCLVEIIDFSIRNTDSSFTQD